MGIFMGIFMMDSRGWAYDGSDYLLLFAVIVFQILNHGNLQTKKILAQIYTYDA